MMDKELIEAMVDAVEVMLQPKRGAADPVYRTLPPWPVVMETALEAALIHLEANGLVVVNEERLHRRLTCVGVLRNLNPSMASIMAENDIRALKIHASQKKPLDDTGG